MLDPMALLTASWLHKPVWLWLFFLGIVLLLLALDLGVLHCRDTVIDIKESLRDSAGYIGVGILFGMWVWWWLGSESGELYFTGFVLEKSLSLDNIFVISLIFAHMNIPRSYQHRVLFWGIIGVIFLRGLLIISGAALVAQFHWILLIFGAFLLLTGFKMLFAEEKEPNIGENGLIRLLRRVLPVTSQLHGHAFLVRLPDEQHHRRRMTVHATPLLVALILVESADLIFAVDSVPAILAVTQDPYLVLTSNVFAILGLRALYFALAAMLHRFKYLKYGLSLVLVFIGAKIFVVALGVAVDPTLSLVITVGLLVGSVLLSLLWTRHLNHHGKTRE